MDKQQILEIYNKLVKPRVFWFKLIAALCWVQALTFCVFSTQYEGRNHKTDWQYNEKIQLKIVSQLPGEIKTTKEELKKEYLKKIAEEKINLSQALADDEPGGGLSLKEKEQNNDSAGPVKKNEEPNYTEWIAKNKQLQKELVDKYSQKITIKKNNLNYQIRVSIRDFPRRNGFWGALGIEVYSADKKRLFTYYGKSFWSESGFEGGEYWSERNLYNYMNLQFPYAGDYYILAGVPEGKNQKEAYEAFLSHSNGVATVKISTYRWFYYPMGDDEFYMTWIFIFFIIGLIFWKLAKRSTLNKKNIFYKKLDFENNQYLCQIPGKGTELEDELYYISGISRIEKKHNSLELILERNGEQKYLEIERETEEGVRYYYLYLYEALSGKKYPEVPEESIIEYAGKQFKRLTRKLKLKNINFSYANGMTEKVSKYLVDYGTRDEKNYLSFEYTDDKGDYELSFGEEIHKVLIWGGKK